MFPVRPAGGHYSNIPVFQYSNITTYYPEELYLVPVSLMAIRVQ